MARRSPHAVEPVRVRAAAAARNPVRFGSQLSQAAARHVSRRGCRRGGQFQGPHLRLQPRRQQPWPGLRQHRRAAARVRPDGNYLREIGKNLYAWSFAHTVRVDKDDNIWATDKGSDMIIKFNPGRPRADGVRPQAGSLGEDRAARARQSAASPMRTAASASPPTSPGIPPATSTSATATSMPASPRSARTATGSSPGASTATARASSTCSTPSRPTPRTTSMWATATTGASRCSTPTATSSARSGSTCRRRPTRTPRSATCPT